MSYQPEVYWCEQHGYATNRGVCLQCGGVTFRVMVDPLPFEGATIWAVSDASSPARGAYPDR